MDFNSTRIPLAIVSTDTTALREVSWTLSAYGYQALTSSDWSEQAPWRRSFAPGVVIFDARDEEQVEIALASPRSTPYTYRIALCDANLLGKPDGLMDLGADDLIKYPLNAGELISCLRRGSRRLEFERRFNLAATFDQNRGVANKRGFTLQLDRKLKENSGAADHALIVLGIDYLDIIRAQQGAAAVENACSLAAETIHGGLSAQDCRGILDEGVFAILLDGQSVSDGVLFAKEVNEQFAAVLGKGMRLSLSGAAVGWPSGDTAAAVIQRATTALNRIKAWGGNQVLEINEVEREYTAWNLKFTTNHATDARQAMEAFPLILPLNSALGSGGMGIASFAAGPLPPCVPVVDDVGHLVGVVDGKVFETHGNEVFDALNEYLEPVAVTLRGDTRFDEVVGSLESTDAEYVLVVDNKKPIGYVTHDTVAALQFDDAEHSGQRELASADWGLNSLVVPLI